MEDTVDYHAILLTGVTGYVGMYLLKELLYSFESRIYVLVRGNSQADAEERFKQKVNYYFLDSLDHLIKGRVSG